MSTTTLLIVYFGIGLGILIWFVSRDPDTFKGEKFSGGFGLFLGLAICYVALWPPILVCAAFQLVARPLGKLIEKSFAKWDAVVARGRVSKWIGQFLLSKPSAEEIQAAQNWAAKNNEFDKRIVRRDYSGFPKEFLLVAVLPSCRRDAALTIRALAWISRCGLGTRRTFLKTAIFAALGLRAILRGETNSPQRKELKMEIKKVGSQPSSKGPADWFTGTVRLDPLFDAPEPARSSQYF